MAVSLSSIRDCLLPGLHAAITRKSVDDFLYDFDPPPDLKPDFSLEEIQSAQEFIKKLTK